MSDEKLSLVNVKGGAVLEAFDIRLQEILDNICDPNTVDKPRKITLEVTFAPDPDRNFVKILFSCKSGMAPDRPISTYAEILKSGKKPELFEIQRPQQAGLDFGTGEVSNVKQLKNGRV